MTWIQPVFDRTQKDLERAVELAEKVSAKGYGALSNAEKEEWLAGLKGAYNNSDLNRVESNVGYLAETLKANGYLVNTLPKASWGTDELPTKDEMKRYLKNIQILLASFIRVQSAESLPENMDCLTYQKANAIEKILSDIGQLIQNMLAAFRHSGTFNSGMEGLRV